MPDEKLVLRLSPFPLPELDGVDTATRKLFQQQVYPLWDSYLKAHTKAPGPYDDPTDFELFVEQVARLHAALHYYSAEQIWLYKGSETATNLTSGVVRTRQQLLDEGAQEYGVIHRHDHSTSELNRQQELAEAYANYDTFRRHSHRTLALAGFNPDHEQDLDMVEFLQRLQERGVERAFIKTVAAKYAASFVELNSPKYDVLKQAVFESFDWALVHFEGRREAFLVQEAIEMQYEYRFFIVGNRLVTGAGCVEEYTPLQNANCFDTRMRKFRMLHGDPVIESPGIVSQYREFAENVVHEFAQEVPELHDYVLDVTLTDKGPAIVELNGLANSGLYASDPARIVEAIALA